MARGRYNYPLDNAITRGVEGRQVWASSPLTYAYASDAEAWTATWETGRYLKYVSLGQAHRAAVEIALDAVERVTALRFTKAANFASADLKFVGFADPYGLESFVGFAQFPYWNPKAGAIGEYESYIVLDTTHWSVQYDPRVKEGAFLVHLALHELGHALGLGHPHDWGNGTTAWAHRAVTRGDDPLDNERFTVMSYESGGTDVAWASWYGHAVTPMAIDIAALQHIYGRNATAHSGPTTYRLVDPFGGPPDVDGEDGSVTIGRAFYCIWDAGGVDTIRYDGARSVSINLNDATLDRADPQSVGLVARLERTDVRTRLPQELERELMDPRINAGGFFSRLFSGPEGDVVLGGYSIARGCVIENAVGGRGDDVLIGNEFANELAGGGGSDLLVGEAGADLLVGGAGRDELWGGPGADRFVGRPIDLDGDRIHDLASEDSILLEGVVLDRRDLRVDPASWELWIDSDRNGSHDTRIDLEGNFSAGRFLVEPASGGATGTVVRYTLAPNLLPVALDDRALTARERPVAIDVLANDYDPDGFLDTESVRITSAPVAGTLTVGRDGKVLYTPDGETIGEVRFRYRVADLDGGLSNEAEVSVLVTPETRAGGGGNDRIVGTAGDDWIHGRAGNDRLGGSHGNDVLVGGSGNDKLAGGAGDDILLGGLGRDVLDGGPGLDIAVLLGPSSDFRFASRGRKRTIEGLSGTEGGDSLAGIERVQFTDGWLDTTTGTFRPGYASVTVETLLTDLRSWVEA